VSDAAPLPADVRHWPSDPYELLGVSNRASPDEVRAAHDRLAAPFDPVHNPEPCRRLQAARDAVLRDLELLLLLETPLTLQRQTSKDPVPTQAEPPPAVDLDLSEAVQASVSWEAIAAAPLTAGKNPVIGLWQRALAGQEAEAYRGLVHCLDRDGRTADVCLRLYWLLTARPELDREHVPCDWLVHGLLASELSGPLWELYRRALADDPEEALSRRCTDLFEAHAEVDALVELVRLRWLAAGRAQQWEVIAGDLKLLRDVLPAEERVAWALVWSAGLDQLVWSDAKAARELAAQCFQSLRTAQSVAPQMEEQKQRAERLRDLAAGWRALRPEPEAPPPLLVLIPLSWSRPFLEVRPKLLAYLAEALRLPRAFLTALDALRMRPVVLAQFGRLLEQLQETLPPPPLEARSSRDLAELAFAFLDTTDRSYFRPFRTLLLEFCVREAIAPETLAELVAENPYYWLTAERHLAEAVADDEPLRLAYQAQRLFWA
jgi:hypothetical protein